MPRLVIAEDPANAASWETHDVDDVCEFLASRFEFFPRNARLYHGQVAQACDVTPADEAGVERLAGLPGPFYVVLYPAGAVGDRIGQAFRWVGDWAESTWTRFKHWLNEKDDKGKNKPSTSPSPNNSLSDRKNEARPLERIPDIFGTFRSVPDLIAVPYRVFETVDEHNFALEIHREVEVSFMCVGRGAYEIERVKDSETGAETGLFDVRDGATLVANIDGVSVEVYPPITGYNAGPPLVGAAGSDPQVRIGPAITEPLHQAKRCEAVGDQVLQPPNRVLGINSKKAVAFLGNGVVALRPDSGFGFLEYFLPGDTVSISDAGTVPIPADYGKYFHPVFAMRSPVDGWRIAGYEGRGPTFTQNGTDYLLPWPGECDTDYRQTGYLGSELLYDTDARALYRFRFTNLGYVNLNGDYVVEAVTNGALTLHIAGTPQAAAWAALPTRVGNVPLLRDYTTATFSANARRWVGSTGGKGFFLDAAGARWIYINLVAPAGLYKMVQTSTGTMAQNPFDVAVAVQVTPVHANGTTPRGDPEAFGGTTAADFIIRGSKTTRTQRALTIRIKPAMEGPWLVRVARLTEEPADFVGAGEVQWRDLYAMKPLTRKERAALGDVTTVYAVTHATSTATKERERRLNLLVTRKVKRRGVTSYETAEPVQARLGWAAPTTVTCGLDSDGFSTDLIGTAQGDDIFVAICRDPKIGGRALSDLDLDNIYGAVDDARMVFGTSQAVEFCATLDKDNLSFEDSISQIAETLFCNAYRLGSKIRLALERGTPHSTLLFNHRNKIPGTEKRTVAFGTPEGFDGVEFEYIDPQNDKVETVRLPVDASGNPTALNPKKAQSVGIRNRRQAYFHAARLWNKLQYQHVAVEFETTEEAALLVINDRILVADNTRPETQDGEVLAQNVFELTLSQDVTFEGGKTYTIFLQHVDGTVESMTGVVAGSGANVVVIPRTPRLPLATDEAGARRAGYQLVADDDGREREFLVTEVEPQSRLTAIVRAVNYDDRYYQADGVEEPAPIVGRFVAIAPRAFADCDGPWNAQVAMSTDNGLTWEAVHVEDAYYTGIANGNGLLVSMGFPYDSQQPAGYSCCSGDGGEYWACAASSDTDFQCSSVAHDGFGFVCVGFLKSLVNPPRQQGDAGRALTTTDGQTWNTVALPLVPGDGNLQLLGGWWAVAGGAGVFVAVNTCSNVAARSTTHGASWTSTTLPAIGNWVDVWREGSTFVALAMNTGGGTYGGLAVSSDGGVTWGPVIQLPGPTLSFKRVLYFNGLWIVLRGSSTTYYTTPDLSGTPTWTPRTLPYAQEDWHAAVGNGYLVLVGSTANGSVTTCRTTDGINWTYSTLPWHRRWSGITFIPDV